MTTMELLQETLVSFAIILVGCELLGWLFRDLGRWIKKFAVARHEKRIAARLQRGDDSYFEELRSLQAYDPSRSDQISKAPIWQRCVGYALIAAVSTLLGVGSSRFWDWAFSV